MPAKSNGFTNAGRTATEVNSLDETENSASAEYPRRTTIPPTFIHQLSRSRWRIDFEVFQTITTDCHLKHPAVHQSTALLVLTMIRLLAYTLSSIFYRRQVCSHARGPGGGFHEFAKRLAYSFVALSPDAS